MPEGFQVAGLQDNGKDTVMALVWRIERDRSGLGHYAVYENGVLVDRLDSLVSVNRDYPRAVPAHEIFSVAPSRSGVTTAVSSTGE